MQFLFSFIQMLFSSVLLKRNLDWHRRLVAVSFPIFFLALLAQAEYITYRTKRNG
ncbi:hypothetical protein [Niallia taxi]|uniref:hypothetical protein n=1 Tax=Niallia taxi TaxID=2499688 RepID=UPI002E1BB805|nr:hypothetical protein [Niallia taxi]